MSWLGYHLRASAWVGALLAMLGASCCPEVAPGADVGNAGDGSIPGSARLTLVQQEVFDRSCVTDCHEATNAAADLRLSPGRSHANLVNVASKQVASEIRVVPGDADRSYLVKKLEGGAGIVGDQMPRLLPPLDTSRIELVRRWISRGAPND